MPQTFIYGIHCGMIHRFRGCFEYCHSLWRHFVAVLTAYILKRFVCELHSEHKKPRTAAASKSKNPKPCMAESRSQILTRPRPDHCSIDSARSPARLLRPAAILRPELPFWFRPWPRYSLARTAPGAHDLLRPRTYHFRMQCFRRRSPWAR